MKLVGTLILLASVALLVTEPMLAVSGPVRAQSDPDVDEDAQKEELRRLQNQIRENERKAEELKGKENKELKALRDTEKKERGVKRQISSLNRRQRNLKGELKGVRSDLVTAEGTYETRRRQLGARLRGLYKMGRHREFEYVAASRSFTELAVRLDYLERIAEQDRYLLIAIDNEKERITLAQEKLDSTLDKVQANAKRKQREQNKLHRLSQEKQQQVASIQGEREAYEAAAAELRKTARQIQRLLAELERQRTGRDILPPYEGKFSAGKTQLPWPVYGDVVGRYGNETHPKWGTVTFNSGVDIAAPLGTDVRAVAKGRVDHVSYDFGSYGQIIILNHGEGYYSLYAHLSAILVSRGDEVEPGSVIARVGDTGSLKGSVLHFEIRKGRSAVDPEEWLR
jgi:septal ring factor EnvC (AmiA/AmiB activator)